MKTRFTYLYLLAAAAAIVLSPANNSDAKVINAASCRFADVSNAVLQASPGTPCNFQPAPIGGVRR